MSLDPAKPRSAVRSTSLTEAAYERLRADIIDGRLSPGTKLRINDLCGQLEVSLGAVREALSRLVAEGFVLSEAQRGFQVAPISGADLADLTETRIEVENLALRRAAQAGDVQWESKLVAAFHHLSRVPERDPADPARLNDEWVRTHAAFHAALVEGCDSIWIKRIRDMLYAQSERYRRLSALTRESGRAGRDALAEHRGIMNAMLDKNADEACRLMTEHLGRTTHILLDAGLADRPHPDGGTPADHRATVGSLPRVPRRLPTRGKQDALSDGRPDRRGSEADMAVRPDRTGRASPRKPPLRRK